MAKIFRFSLLFCFGFFAFQPIEASNTKAHFPPIQTVIDSCDAPAPDSFRITQTGGNFISLAWVPAWPGAVQAISVAEKNPSGQWISIQIYPYVQGNSFTVDNLNAGREYKFRIATYCSGNTELSHIKTDGTGVTSILELTLAGRVPVNPTPISCQNIKYMEHNWIGFRVIGPEGSNIFEVVMNDAAGNPTAFIRRVHNVNQIVAADNDGNFPDNIFGAVQDVEPPFKVLKLNAAGEPTLIGKIGFNVNINPSMLFESIDVCPENEPSWKEGYSFVFLKANSVLPPNNGGSNGLVVDPKHRFIRFSNPFNGNFEINFSNINPPESEEIVVNLFDMSGKLIISITSHFTDATITLPTANLSMGCYILQILSNSVIETRKILKFD